ncbi:hypothetical protein Bca52824_007941 [Brassica carinata]|uniref:RING-type E3 ubiquitin transferase n=1 Tax=Brassica carinata TaxID=52824 RepID=A0A8X7WB03_BRACI|nr:hypothetical protein Bca52824_007941 [Brassica carinata]
MQENGEVVLARPISRVHCRQRYNLKLEAGKTKLGAILEMSIVEEGLGSRKGCVRTRVYLSIPMIEGRSRQCRSGGLLTLYMNVLVRVDHYHNIRRGIKIDQDHRIIKADQYDGVWDSDSIVVDHEEGWKHIARIYMDEDKTLRYTFPHANIAIHQIRFEPASESAVRRLKISRVEEKICCAICLEDLPVGSAASTLPCQHHFHTGCILEWLKTSRFCPTCRLVLPAEERIF